MARGNISRGTSQKHIKNNLRVHLGPCAYRSHSIKMQTEIGANSQLPTFKSNKHGSIPDLGSVNPELTRFYFPWLRQTLSEEELWLLWRQVSGAAQSGPVWKRASAYTSGFGLKPCWSGCEVNWGAVFCAGGLSLYQICMATLLWCFHFNFELRIYNSRTPAIPIKPFLCDLLLS